MITNEVVYRKDDVWLCKCGGELAQLTILNIVNGYIEFTERGHGKTWISSVDWQVMVRRKVGTVRRILGIRCGIKR